jgi:signal transduction histidine kinase
MLLPAGSRSRRSSDGQFGSDTLAKIIDASPIPSFVIDQQHRVTHWNPALNALTGIAIDDILGTEGQWRAFYGESRPVMADLIVDRASDAEIAGLYGKKCRKSTLIDGAYEAEDFFPALGDKGKWLRFTASPIRDNDGVTFGAIETLEDVTDRKLAEENLHFYLKAITSAQEQERRRVSRELHDDTVQLLGSVSRQLDNFIRTERRLKPERVLLLKDIQNQLNAGAQSVHRFSQALRLSVLDDLGLVPALRSLVSGLGEVKVAAELRVIGDVTRFPPEVETTLFRIVQEAVNNIRKHAAATDAWVTVEFAGDRIHLTVEDNGNGFGLTENVDALPRSGRLGLAGIQERVRLLGGSFEVVSARGKGTKLIVAVPVG